VIAARSRPHRVTSATAESGISGRRCSGSASARIAATSSRVDGGRRTVTSNRFSPSHSSLATWHRPSPVSTKSWTSGEIEVVARERVAVES
jgi:hypothetical protein